MRLGIYREMGGRFAGRGWFGSNVWSANVQTASVAFNSDSSKIAILGDPNGYVKVSTNGGVSWGSNVTSFGAGETPFRMRHLNGYWICLSQYWDDYSYEQYNYFDYTTDPNTWTNYSYFKSDSQAWNAKDVIYDGSKYWTAAYNNVRSSTNLASWTSEASIGSGIRIMSLAYGNSKYVAGGYGGALYYSSNGTSWAAAGGSTFGSSSINAMCYGDKFIAGTTDGKIGYSSDGNTWTSTTGCTQAKDIRYIDGLYWLTSVAGLKFSEDGISWSIVGGLASPYPYCVDGDDTLMISGRSAGFVDRCFGK